MSDQPTKKQQEHPQSTHTNKCSVPCLVHALKSCPHAAAASAVHQQGTASHKTPTNNSSLPYPAAVCSAGACGHSHLCTTRSAKTAASMLKPQPGTAHGRGRPRLCPTRLVALGRVVFDSAAVACHEVRVCRAGAGATAVPTLDATAAGWQRLD